MNRVCIKFKLQAKPSYPGRGDKLPLNVDINPNILLKKMLRSPSGKNNFDVLGVKYDSG